MHKCDSVDLARESIYNLLEVYIDISSFLIIWVKKYINISFTFQVGCVCNNAVINGESLLGQPTEGAILAAGMKVSLYHSLALMELIKIIFNNWIFFSTECMEYLINIFGFKNYLLVLNRKSWWWNVLLNMVMYVSFHLYFSFKEGEEHLLK